VGGELTIGGQISPPSAHKKGANLVDRRADGGNDNSFRGKGVGGI